MRLFNIINCNLQDNIIKVFVEPCDFFAVTEFKIESRLFEKFLHETLAIDGTTQDYFNENNLDIIIDGIYCYVVYNQPIIL